MNTNPEYPILVVDDDKQTLESMEVHLLSMGFDNILLCPDSRNVENIVKQQDLSLILLDLAMPNITGEELLVFLTENYPEIPVVMVTGTHDIEIAVNCMKKGAYDFLLKPVKNEMLHQAVHRALENNSLRREIENLRDQVLSSSLKKPEVFASMVTQNQKMTRIFHYIEAVGPSGEPVLITGEPGVGKELISQALHDISGRTGPFLSVNVAGLDDHMFTDTLFGHKKGSFTGALQARKGLVEQAEKGTLFLDEIGDLSPASQVKLLRFLQENEYFPIGSDIPKYADCRILVATNRNLPEMIEKGEFRKDLFYRLKVHSIKIPPLRHRLDDLPYLIDFFLEEAAEANNKSRPEVTYELLSLFEGYDFPGNIRELRAILYDAVCLMIDETLPLDEIHSRLQEHKGNEPDNSEPDMPAPADSIIRFIGKLPGIKEMGDKLIEEALRRSNGNQAQAAKLLDMSPQALNQRLKRKK